MPNPHFRPSEPGSDTATLTRTCPFCKHTGQCGKCEGSGISVATTRGRFSKRVLHDVECRACEGSGVCPLCHGSGELDG